MNRDDVLEMYAEHINTQLDRAARQILRAGNMPAVDIEDIKQELFLHLLRRLPSYDPDRGELKAFITYTIDRRSPRVLSTMRAGGAECGVSVYSLYEPVPGECGDCITREDAIDDQEYRLSVGTISRSAQEQAEMRADIHRVLRLLTPRHKDLCQRLMVKNINQVALEMGVSRQWIYSQIHRLRPIFSQFGMEDYL